MSTINWCQLQISWFVYVSKIVLGTFQDSIKTWQCFRSNVFLCFVYGFISKPAELNNQAALREAEAGWMPGQTKKDTGKDFHRKNKNCPAVMRLIFRNPTPVDEFFSISYRSYTSHVVGLGISEPSTAGSHLSFPLLLTLAFGYLLYGVILLRGYIGIIIS